MKKIIILAALLIILIPLGTWWFSPEQVVKRRTTHLMEVLALAADSGGTVRQAKVFSLNRLLGPELRISSPAIPATDGTFDKQEIESGFSWICKNARRTEFRVTSFNEIEIAADRAKVHATVRALVELPAYRPLDGPQNLLLEWSEHDDGWRLEKTTLK